MDFSQFDTRNYPTLSVQEGYGEWAATYEDSVLDAMDLRLLAKIRSVAWDQLREAADLACGTGRTGVWLKQQGVASLDGVDLTPAMLEGARAKGGYRQLFLGDVRETPLQARVYDLVTISLADEHLPDVRPLYQESARIARTGGYFVLVGYHPFFLMSGIPTHFNRASGEPATIQTYVHLISDHVQAALASGWSLLEMHEGLIDEEWLAQKPKWGQYHNRPVSFVMVWQKQRQAVAS
ncbi:MAG TPA: class I SAM-dependent methyltransferase [Ktedonobacterales bacterium]